MSYNVDMDKVSAVVHDEASNSVLAGECIGMQQCTVGPRLSGPQRYKSLDQPKVAHMNNY